MQFLVMALMLGLITQFCFGYGIVFKDEKNLTGGGIMLVQVLSFVVFDGFLDGFLGVMV